MDVTLPKWGMTMQEATITMWHFKVGDEVTEGQPLATVETEKVDAEVEVPADGVLEEIVAQEGETVAVGAVIARLRTA